MSSFGFLEGTSDKPKTDKASEDTLRPEKPQTPPESKQSIASFDLDKLAYAVAMAETNNCTKGAGRSKNNCFGIMHWPNGKRTLRYFPTPEASYEEFKRIWMKSYKRFPDLALARKWTGNDKPQTWLNIVKHYYGL